MILNDSIKIVSLDDVSASELQQIDTRLRTLLMSTENTIPGSRAFGLSGDYLDSPIGTTASELAVELQEKADIYLPEVKIEAVAIDHNLNGQLEIKISVKRRESRD